jgi:hypothetical protein
VQNCAFRQRSEQAPPVETLKIDADYMHKLSAA